MQVELSARLDAAWVAKVPFFYAASALPTTGGKPRKKKRAGRRDSLKDMMMRRTSLSAAYAPKVQAEASQQEEMILTRQPWAEKEEFIAGSDRMYL